MNEFLDVKSTNTPKDSDTTVIINDMNEFLDIKSTNIPKDSDTTVIINNMIVDDKHVTLTLTCNKSPERLFIPDNRCKKSKYKRKLKYR